MIFVKSGQRLIVYEAIPTSYAGSFIDVMHCLMAVFTNTNADLVVRLLRTFYMLSDAMLEQQIRYIITRSAHAKRIVYAFYIF